MTSVAAKTKAVAGAVGSLASLASRVASVLTKVWKVAQGGADLRTAVLFGGLGFFIATPAAMIACSYYGLVALAPPIAIAAGGIGITLGLLAGRRISVVSGAAQDIWSLAAAEVAKLDAQIKINGKDGRNNPALEDKRDMLQTASPGVLQAYYSPMLRHRAAVSLSDVEKDALAVLQRPIAAPLALPPPSSTT